MGAGSRFLEAGHREPSEGTPVRPESTAKSSDDLLLDFETVEEESSPGASGSGDRPVEGLSQEMATEGEESLEEEGESPEGKSTKKPTHRFVCGVGTA